MTVIAGIVAHVNREAMARDLAQQVDAEILSLDDGSLGCEGNHRETWNVLATRVAWPTDYCVALEDDALPVSGFISQLQRAIEVAPTPVISLYLGRLRPPPWQQRISDAVEKADANNASWIVGTHLLHAVGVAIRADLLPSLLEYESDLPADEHISTWAQEQGHEICYTWPSLVDHRDEPTLFTHRDRVPRVPGRVAWRCEPRTTWTRTAVEL